MGFNSGFKGLIDSFRRSFASVLKMDHKQRGPAENYKIFNSDPVTRDQSARYLRLVWLWRGGWK